MWRRLDRWIPENVDPDELPHLIVCPPRNWRLVHPEVADERPLYPVHLAEPMQNLFGDRYRAFEVRHTPTQEYQRFHQWIAEHVRPTIVEPVFTREMVESATQATGEEFTLERLQEFRERYLNEVPEIPDWQRRVLQAMIEGRHIIVSRARRAGFEQIGRMLGDIAGDYTIVGNDLVPEDTMLVYDDEADPWPPIPNLSGSLPTLNELADRLGIASRVASDPEEIPDVTDEDRERWTRAIDTAPTQQGGSPGAGMTIDELLGDIDLALTEYREERDGA